MVPCPKAMVMKPKLLIQTTRLRHIHVSWMEKSKPNLLYPQKPEDPKSSCFKKKKPLPLLKLYIDMDFCNNIGFFSFLIIKKMPPEKHNSYINEITWVKKVGY